MSDRRRSSVFANCSVVELMVLALTGVVSLLLVGIAATVAIVEIVEPTADTSRIVESLTSIISGILGALLGLLAGKSESLTALGSRPDGSVDRLVTEEEP
jgi:hypothetical protein